MVRETEISVLHEVVDAVAAATPAAREVVPGLRRRPHEERRVRVTVLQRAGLQHRAGQLEIDVAADERDEVGPRLHVVDEAPERAVVELSSGQSFIRRAVQALAEVTRSRRRVGRIVGRTVRTRRLRCRQSVGRCGAGTRDERASYFAARSTSAISAPSRVGSSRVVMS